MDKSKATEKLKREYEKVYENPLDWCPLLGYIPAFEETNITQNDDIYRTWDKYQGIIEKARDYYLNICFKNMQKYISVPDVILTLSDNPPWLHIPEKEFKAIRRLFQNLDYLILKTAHDTRAVNLCQTIKTNMQGIPYKPIGRINNSIKNNFSVIAGEIDIIRDVPTEFRSQISFADLEKVNSDMSCARQSDIDHFDVLLFEARKIAGAQAKLNHQKLFSLLAILESWLVLTSLLFNPHQCEQIDVLYEIEKKLSYPKELLSLADSFEKREERQIAARQKAIDKESKKEGGKKKRNIIKEFCKSRIEKSNFATDQSVFDYLKNNHKKSKPWKKNGRGIYWRASQKIGEEKGIIVEYDINRGGVSKSNIFKSFQVNFNKAKKKINNKIKN